MGPNIQLGGLNEGLFKPAYQVGISAIVNMPPKENMPAELTKLMIDNDFAWAAQNKAQILDEWRKRFDVKTEPKK